MSLQRYDRTPSGLSQLAADSSDRRPQTAPTEALLADRKRALLHAIAAKYMKRPVVLPRRPWLDGEETMISTYRPQAAQDIGPSEDSPARTLPTWAEAQTDLRGGGLIQVAGRSEFVNRGGQPYQAPQRPAPLPDRLSPDQRVKPEVGGVSGAAVGVAKLLNDIGAWNDFFKQVQIYNDFQAAGGLDGVVTVDPDSFQPMIMRDISGGLGIKMQNGTEFWAMRLRPNQWKPGFNVQIRQRVVGDRTIYEYKYDGSGGWTEKPPRIYGP